MGMKIWWFEKGSFDEISWMLVVRGDISILIESKNFYVDGARCFSFEFFRFHFKIIFVFYSCCVKLGADFFLLLMLSRSYYKLIIDCLGRSVWMKYLWSIVTWSVALIRFSCQFSHLGLQWCYLQIPWTQSLSILLWW